MGDMDIMVQEVADLVSQGTPLEEAIEAVVLTNILMEGEERTLIHLVHVQRQRGLIA